MGGAAVGAFVAGAVALAASLLHLGRPAQALKALRNLRTSWLSREVALFSAFSGAVAGLRRPRSARLVGVLAVAGGGGRRVRQRAPLPGAGPAGVELVADARRLLRHRRRPPGPSWPSSPSTGPGWPAAGSSAWSSMAAVGTLAQLAVAGPPGEDRAAPDRPPAPGHGPPPPGAVRGTVPVAGWPGRASACAPGRGAVGPLAAAAAGGRLAAALVVVAAGELAGRYLFYVTVVPFSVAGSFFKGPLRVARRCGAATGLRRRRHLRGRCGRTVPARPLGAHHVRLLLGRAAGCSSGSATAGPSA